MCATVYRDRESVIAVNCVNLVYKKVQCDKDELLIMSVNIE